MQFNVTELLERAKFSVKRKLPGPTRQERESWQAALLVSSMTIGSKYVGISREDLKVFRIAYMKSFWSGSDSLGRKILSFDPEINQKGFYLFGKPGVGKTSILKALAIRLAKQFPEEVIFTQLKHAIDAMSEEDFQFKAEIQKKLTSCRFLFIDDIGVERSTEWTREQIYSVLDQRLYSHAENSRRKFTFLSSNLSFDELSKRYHARDVRRIFEMAELVEVKREGKHAEVV